MRVVVQTLEVEPIIRSCPLLAFERRSWAGIPLAFLAPALPANREAVALQGRAVRAGARDTPLSARPTLAVIGAASFLSFTLNVFSVLSRLSQELGRVDEFSPVDVFGIPAVNQA